MKELELINSKNEVIFIEKQKVQMNKINWRRPYKIIIFLEDVNSIENIYSGNIIWLILAILAAIVFITAFENTQPFTINIFPLLFFIGFELFFIGLWGLNRKQYLIIQSKAAKKLKFSLEGISDEQADEFIQKLGTLKNRKNL